MPRESYNIDVYDLGLYEKFCEVLDFDHMFSKRDPFTEEVRAWIGKGSMVDRLNRWMKEKDPSINPASVQIKQAMVKDCMELWDAFMMLKGFAEDKRHRESWLEKLGNRLDHLDEKLVALEKQYREYNDYNRESQSLGDPAVQTIGGLIRAMRKGQTELNDIARKYDATWVAAAVSMPANMEEGYRDEMKSLSRICNEEKLSAGKAKEEASLIQENYNKNVDTCGVIEKKTTVLQGKKINEKDMDEMTVDLMLCQARCAIIAAYEAKINPSKASEIDETEKNLLAKREEYSNFIETRMKDKAVYQKKLDEMLRQVKKELLRKDISLEEIQGLKESGEEEAAMLESKYNAALDYNKGIDKLTGKYKGLSEKLKEQGENLSDKAVPFEKITKSYANFEERRIKFKEEKEKINAKYDSIQNELVFGPGNPDYTKFVEKLEYLKADWVGIDPNNEDNSTEFNDMSRMFIYIQQHAATTQITEKELNQMWYFAEFYLKRKQEGLHLKLFRSSRRLPRLEFAMSVKNFCETMRDEIVSRRNFDERLKEMETSKAIEKMNAVQLPNTAQNVDTIGKEFTENTVLKSEGLISDYKSELKPIKDEMQQIQEEEKVFFAKTTVNPHTAVEGENAQNMQDHQMFTGMQNTVMEQKMNIAKTAETDKIKQSLND